MARDDWIDIGKKSTHRSSKPWGGSTLWFVLCASPPLITPRYAFSLFFLPFKDFYSVILADRPTGSTGVSTNFDTFRNRSLYYPYSIESPLYVLTYPFNSLPLIYVIKLTANMISEPVLELHTLTELID